MNTQQFPAILLPGIRLNPDGSAPEEMLLRAKAAYSVKQHNPVALIVTLGADVAGVGISEAEALKRALVQMGVSETDILCEDKSFITAENFQNAAKIARVPKRCALVTSDYHMARAKLLAHRAGFKVKGFKAKTPSGKTKRKRRVLEVLGIIDALCGWQDPTKTRPKAIEKFKRFISRALIGHE